MEAGITLLLCVGIIIVVVAVVVLVATVRVVPEYQRLVVLRLGRVTGPKGPGLVLLLPFVDQPKTVDLREQIREVPHQTSITSVASNEGFSHLRSCGAPAMVRFFDDSFTVCAARSGGHILCYVIPGAGAATEVGRRRLNWVWYVNVPEGPDLTRLLTDRTGAVRDASVPPGLVPDELTAELHAAAAHELHPRLVELVQASAEPFIQVIRDVTVPRMAFGRACLLGDAAFVLRPHPGAATAKAAADAMALATALAAQPTDADAALRAWEKQQLEHGQALLDLAAALGRRSVDRRDDPPTLRDVAERFADLALGGRG